MKKLFILFAFLAFSLAMTAQRKGEVTTLTVDTIDSASAVNFPLGEEITGNVTIAIQALCTQTSGTSEGNLYVEASLDGTSYETLTTTSGFFAGFPNDTLTIADGAVGVWYLENSPFSYYRLQGTGGASDATKVTVKWVYKDQ